MSRQPDRPFLWGVQYYRAPTPGRECWSTDLARIRELGFTSVKYWAQWRWAQRAEDRFVFDDLDELMDLAQTNGLEVHINTVFDVAPHWLHRVYPDALQVTNRRGVVTPHEVAHRQLGGNPGPCYTHPGARMHRERFLRATVERFRSHPAMAAWDVWNEPELCFPQRAPEIDGAVCYCESCQARFIDWLIAKYGTLDRLNQVWGRCYEEWDEVEAPRTGLTITDFVDWREFHVSVMTEEARWRLRMVREIDPGRTAFLHVVPNLMGCFNTIGCATDDFELFEECDVAAASFNDTTEDMAWMVSSGRGKTVWNTETHLNYGSTNMHQRVLGLDDVVRAFVPQVGGGVRGFQFWQYRSETLGFESPAWGVVRTDGSDRPVTQAVREFRERLGPLADDLARCPAAEARVGIWRSRKNEIFHFCLHRSPAPLIESVAAYRRLLYWDSVPFRYVTDGSVATGDLEGLEVLIMPAPYYLVEEEARAIDDWVRRGGILLCEAHLGAYNGTTGRHSTSVPGLGLAEAWGVRELETTSSYHLKLERSEALKLELTDDTRKAIAASGLEGGLYFPMVMCDGTIVWGAERYAELGGEGFEPLAEFEPGVGCLGTVSVGLGLVMAIGTHAGRGATRDASGLHELLKAWLAQSSVTPTLGAEGDGIHVDYLAAEGGPEFLSVWNRETTARSVSLPEANPSGWRSLFGHSRWMGDRVLEVDGGQADLLVRE